MSRKPYTMMELVSLFFHENDEVIVANLGDGCEYRGKIRGIANDIPPFQGYIVEWIDRPPAACWSCSVITKTCIFYPNINKIEQSLPFDEDDLANLI